MKTATLFLVQLTQYDRDPLTGLQDMDRFTFAGVNAADRANQKLTGDLAQELPSGR